MSKRTCFGCTHFRVCALRMSFTETAKNFRMNINTKDTPGRINDVYDSIANACIHYKSQCES